MFNYYKAIIYICSYLSKGEDECSQVIKKAFKETLEKGTSYYEQMKATAHAYLSKNECSLQEAVYHIMAELWLRNVFPADFNVKSNVPEKRVKMSYIRENCYCCQKIVQIPVKGIWLVVILLGHQKTTLLCILCKEVPVASQRGGE